MNLSRPDLIAHINAELVKLFPNSGVKVFERTILGEANIYVHYRHHADTKNCASGIVENDPAYMLFTIGFTARTAKWNIEFPSTHCNRLMGRNEPLAFRKLSADTETDVANKLIAWFQKNQALILSAPNLPSY